MKEEERFFFKIVKAKKRNQKKEGKSKIFDIKKDLSSPDEKTENPLHTELNQPKEESKDIKDNLANSSDSS